MLKQFYRLFYLVIVLSSCTESVYKNDHKVSHQLDRLFKTYHQNNQFDGTVVIGTSDSIIFRKAIGISNRVWEIPAQMNHRFDICSVNKSFIAALILIASEENKLSLDDFLIDHLKSYSYSGIFNPHITIHQLLCHISGLPDYHHLNDDYSKNKFQKFKRIHFENQEYVNFISLIPPVNQPNKEFYYSNFAYHLLTIILEDLYQFPFSEILKQKITQPLNLNHTFSPENNRQVFANIAEGYQYDNETNTWIKNNFIDFTLGRRIFSTSDDLFLWGKEMSAPKLLSSKIVTLMQTNYLSNITTDISYGYGWSLFDGRGHSQMGNLEINKKYIIHGGSTEGYKSMLVNINDGEYIISFLANTGNQTDELLLTQQITSILLNSENEN